MLRAVLDNQPGPALDIVALNAGAALYVAGVASDIGDGLARARAAIANGSARERLVHGLIQPLRAPDEKKEDF